MVMFQASSARPTSLLPFSDHWPEVRFNLPGGLFNDVYFEAAFPITHSTPGPRISVYTLQLGALVRDSGTAIQDLSI